MKKSLLALAVLGAFAGVASAQSSVTLFGTVDVGGRLRQERTATDRQPERSNERHQQQPARLPGIEDLGGGLKAGFDLLAADAGRRGDTGSGSRRRTASSGIVVRRSACSATSVKSASAATTRRRSGTRRSSTRSAPTASAARVNVCRQLYDALVAPTTRSATSCRRTSVASTVRLMVAAAEGGSRREQQRSLRRWSDRLRRRPVRRRRSLRRAEERIDAANDRGSSRHYNLGGSWDFGVAKLMGYYDRDDLRSNAEQKTGSISAVVPLGQGEIHVGYYAQQARVDTAVRHGSAEGSDLTLDRGAVRTSTTCPSGRRCYGTVSRLSNGTSRRVRRLPAARRSPRPDRRRQVEGLRARPSSLLLIRRSPSEIPIRSKAAFGRPFSLPSRRGASRTIPFDAWRRFARHCLPRRDDATGFASGSRTAPRPPPPTTWAPVLHARLRPSPPRSRPSLVMLTVAFIAFMLFQYVGDPVTNILGQDATPEQTRAAARRPRPRPARSPCSSRASSATPCRASSG